MNSQMAKFHRRGMVSHDGFNTSNLVVQTQNMSLSQESLHNNQQWNSSGMNSNFSNGVPGSMDSANGGYFGCVGPVGPPTMQSRDGTRRASDPIKPLERGFSDPSRRIQRYNSYSNFNYRNQMGLTPPHYNHPNQGLQLDQVGEDEPIENKLILPDDMVNYLNQNGNNDLKLEKQRQPTPPPGTPNSMYSQQMPSSPTPATPSPLVPPTPTKTSRAPTPTSPCPLQPTRTSIPSLLQATRCLLPFTQWATIVISVSSACAPTVARSTLPCRQQPLPILTK
ncbi:UNVERIFIED_CONTAM: hypothetical protein GTU68_055863 [Idotea baltica]|nr:hypothetical protein [Idotea baltica]